MSAGHSRDLRGAQEQRVEAPQLFFQEPGGGAFLVCLERVAANQLGQPIGLVRRRLAGGAHFVEDDGQTLAADLPGRFRSGKTGADDVDGAGQPSG